MVYMVVFRPIKNNKLSSITNKLSTKIKSQVSRYIKVYKAQGYVSLEGVSLPRKNVIELNSRSKTIHLRLRRKYVRVFKAENDFQRYIFLDKSSTGLKHKSRLSSLFRIFCLSKFSTLRYDSYKYQKLLNRENIHYFNSLSTNLFNSSVAFLLNSLQRSKSQGTDLWEFLKKDDDRKKHYGPTRKSLKERKFRKSNVLSKGARHKKHHDLFAKKVSRNSSKKTNTTRRRLPTYTLRERARANDKFNQSLPEKITSKDFRRIGRRLVELVPRQRISKEHLEKYNIKPLTDEDYGKQLIHSMYQRERL